MVGGGGWGKSRMGRNVGKEVELGYVCISCGMGSWGREFIGYKYGRGEKSGFGEFQGEGCIILIEEIRGLDGGVGEMLNGGLGKDEIESSRGLVDGDGKCIIIGSSNSFGFGCDGEYVGNKELDGWSIEGFVGGIVEVRQCGKFEDRQDGEVVEYVGIVRGLVEEENLGKVCCSGMIEGGDNVKYDDLMDWKWGVSIKWRENEKEELSRWLSEKGIEKGNKKD